VGQTGNHLLGSNLSSKIIPTLVTCLIYVMFTLNTSVIQIQFPAALSDVMNNIFRELFHSADFTKFLIP